MSGDFSTVSNHSVEIVLGGNTYRARQLKLRELFGHFESKVKSARIRDAHAMAEGLPPDERVRFLRDAWAALPSGTELMNEAVLLMTSREGMRDALYMCIHDFHPDVRPDDLPDPLECDSSEMDGMIAAFEGLTGIESQDTRSKKVRAPGTRRRTGRKKR
jgi:hypothetical protein